MACFALWMIGVAMALGEQAEGYTTPEITDLGGGRVSYRHFTSEDTSLMHAWTGRNVVLLTRDGHYPDAVVSPLLYDMDKIYDYYRDMAGGDPKPCWSIGGKTTIAEVPDTGPANIDGLWSAAKGFEGHTGIEISTPYFRRIVRGHAAGGGMDHIPYWEMGRNFWYGGAHQVGWKDGIAGVGEAYALAMQIIASKQAGVEPSRQLKKAASKADTMLDLYIRDHRLGYENTMAEGRDSYGNKDTGHWLIAAMVVRLHRDNGGDAFLRKFLDEVRRSEGSSNHQQALDLFAGAASKAAGRDLSRMMRDEWKLPISEEGIAAGRAGSPLPVTTSPLNQQGLGALSGGDLSAPPEVYPYHNEIIVSINSQEEETGGVKEVAVGWELGAGGSGEAWTLEGAVSEVSGLAGVGVSGDQDRISMMIWSERLSVWAGVLAAWLGICGTLGALTRRSGAGLGISKGLV